VISAGAASDAVLLSQGGFDANLSPEASARKAWALSQEVKLIRRAQFPLRSPYLAPRTETETRLAEIWRVALGMDCVGVEDSYHDLGGDSVLAAVIFAEIEESFRIRIPMATLVEAPTVAELACAVELRVKGVG
jgi:acyl carrier protein